MCGKAECVMNLIRVGCSLGLHLQEAAECSASVEDPLWVSPTEVLREYLVVEPDALVIGAGIAAHDERPERREGVTYLGRSRLGCDVLDGVRKQRDWEHRSRTGDG